jgi:hypothetical protein
MINGFVTNTGSTYTLSRQDGNWIATRNDGMSLAFAGGFDGSFDEFTALVGEKRKQKLIPVDMILTTTTAAILLDAKGDLFVPSSYYRPVDRWLVTNK